MLSSIFLVFRFNRLGGDSFALSFVFSAVFRCFRVERPSSNPPLVVALLFDRCAWALAACDRVAETWSQQYVRCNDPDLGHSVDGGLKLLLPFFFLLLLLILFPLLSSFFFSFPNNKERKGREEEERALGFSYIWLLMGWESNSLSSGKEWNFYVQWEFDSL